MDAVPSGVVSGEQGKEEALTVAPAAVPKHGRSCRRRLLIQGGIKCLAVKADDRTISCVLIQTD